MTSYVAKKERVFLEAEPQLAKKRSEGRMKSIGSTIDARVWSEGDEERRQYILDLVKGPVGKQNTLGKFIPVEVLMDILLAQKAADIERLKKKVDLLQKLVTIYEKLELTASQQATFDQMRRNMQISTCELQNITESLHTEPLTTYRSDTEATIDETSFDEDEELPPLQIPRSVEIIACECAAAEVHEEGDYSAKGRMLDNIDSGYKMDYNNMDANALIKLLTERDEEIAAKKSLAKKAIEKLEDMKAVMEERDEIRRELQYCKVKLNAVEKEKGEMAKSIAANVKPPDLCRIESEIAKLRQTECLSTEQETEIIKMELDVLKGYCDKLSNIQEENDQLKRECESLKQKLCVQGDLSLRSSNVGSSGSRIDVKNLEKQLRESNAKIQNLERKMCNVKSEIMESEEYKELLKKSRILDDVIKEKDELEKNLNKLNNAQNKLKQLQKRACEADCLDEQLLKSNEHIQELEKCLLQYQNDMSNLKTEKDHLNSCLENSRMEINDLIKKINDMNKYITDCQALCCERNCLQIEVERLRDKAQLSELLKVEKDRLMLRIEELESLEMEVLQLVEINQINNREKDTLRRQVCEYECIIADQEDELKLLINQIDNMSAACENQQEKYKQSLEAMQRELENKNEIIANSQGNLCRMDILHDELNEMECRLKLTIDKLTNEVAERDNCITNLKCQLESFGVETNNLCKELTDKSDAIKNLKSELGQYRMSTSNSEMIVEKINIELESLQCENAQLHKMIDQLKMLCQSSYTGIILSSSKDTIGVLIKEIHKSGDGLEINFEAENERISGLCKTGDKADRNQLLQALDIAQIEINRLKQGSNSESKSCTCNIDLKKKSETKSCSCDIPSNDIMQLKRQLQTSSESIAKLQKENQSLQTCRCKEEKIIVENVALRRHSIEIESTAKRKISSLSKQLEESLEQVAVLRAEREASLGVDEPSCNANIDELRTKIQEYKEKYMMLRSENDSLNKIIQRLECQVKSERDIAHRIASKDASMISQLKSKLDGALSDVQSLREKEQCSAKMEDLRAEIKDSIECCMILQAENDTLRSTIHRLECEMKKANEESCGRSKDLALVNQLKTQLQEHLSEKIKLDEENCFLKSQMRNLEDDMSSVTSKIDNYECTVLELSKKFQEESNVLKDENNKLRETIQELECYLNEKLECSAANVSLQKYIDHLQDCICSKKEDIDRLCAENSDLKRIVENLNRKLSCLTSDLDSSKSKQSTGSNRQSKSVSLTTDVLGAENMRDTIEQLQACLCSKEEEISRLSTENKELKHFIGNLTNKLDQSSTKTKIDIHSSVSKGISTCGAEPQISQTQTQQVSSEGDVTRLNAENTELRSTVDSLNKKISSLTYDLEQYSGKLSIGTLKEKKSVSIALDASDAEKMKKKLRNLEASLCSKNDDIEMLFTENNKLKYTVDDLNKKVSSLTSELQQLSVKSKLSVDSCGTQAGKKSVDKETTASCDVEKIKELRKTIEMLQEENKGLKNDYVDRLCEENADLKHIVNDLSKKLSSVTSDQEKCSRTKSVTTSASMADPCIMEKIRQMSETIELLEEENKCLKKISSTGPSMLGASGMEIKSKRSKSTCTLIGDDCDKDTLICQLKSDLSDLKNRLQCCEKRNIALEEELENKQKCNMDFCRELKEQICQVKQWGKEVEDQNNSLKCSLEAKNNELATMKFSLEGLNNELEAVKNSLEEKEKELFQTKNKLGAKEKELLETKNKLDEKEEELFVTKNSLDTKTRELLQTKNDLESKAKELFQTKNALDSKEKELLETKNILEDKKKELFQTKNELESKENELAKTKNTLEAKESELTKTKRSLDMMDKELAQTQNRLEAKENELSKTKRSLETREKELAQVKNTLEEKEGELIKTKRSLDEKADELNQYKEWNDEMERQNDKLKSSLDSKEQDLAKFKRNLEETANELTKAKLWGNEIEERNDKLKTSLESKENELAKLSDEFGDIEHAMNKLQTDLDKEQKKTQGLKDINEQFKLTMSGDNDMLQGENDDLKQQLEELKKKLDTLENEAGVAQQSQDDQIKRELEANQRLQEMLRDLEAKTCELKSSPVIAEDVCKPQALLDCEEELNKMREAHEQLQEETNKLKDDNQKLENDLMKTIEDSRNLQTQIRSLETQARVWEDKAKAHEQLASELQNQVHGLSEAFNQAPKEDEFNMLQSRNEELEAKLKELEMHLRDFRYQLESEREKANQLENKIKEMTEDHQNALTLLKNQYDRDLAYTKARAAEALEQLQSRHEEEINSLSRDFERELSHLNKQNENAMKSLQEMENKLQTATQALESEQNKKCNMLSANSQTDDAKGTAVITELTYTCPCRSKDLTKKTALSKRTIVLANVVPEHLEELNIPEFPTAQSEEPTCLTEDQEIFYKAYKYGIRCLACEDLAKIRTLLGPCRNCVSEDTNKVQDEIIKTCVSRAGECRGEIKIFEKDNDRASFMRRIAILENNLSVTQGLAKGKICELEGCLKTYKDHLQNLKKSLECEKQRNIQLRYSIGEKTRDCACIEVERDLLKRQTTVHEGRLKRLVAGMEFEKGKLKKLQEELDVEKINNRQLKAMLDAEKERQDSWKNKTKETFQTMQTRLEEALDNETQMREKLVSNSSKKRSLKTHQSASVTTDLTLKPETKKRNVNQLKIIGPKR